MGRRRAGAGSRSVTKTAATGKDDGRLFGALGSPLVGLAKTRDLEAGQVLIVEGAPTDTLYLIEAGEVDVRIGAARGAVEVGVKGAGSWVGEMGMLVPGPASATVVARTASQVTPITHERYLDLLAREPRPMGVALSRIACDLARRIRRTGEAEVTRGADGHLMLLAHLKALTGVDRCEGPPATRPNQAGTKSMPRVDEGALLRTLDHLGTFRGATEADTRHLAGLRTALSHLALTGISVQTYLHGEPIVKPGERADGVFVLLSGHARVTAGDPHAALHVDKLLEPGTLFGHQAFFDDHMRSASVTASGAAVTAVLWPTAVGEILREAEKGVALWLPVLDWFTRQLVRDARELNARLLHALGGPKPAGGRSGGPPP